MCVHGMLECALCLLRFVAVECGRYGYAEGCEVSSDEFVMYCVSVWEEWVML